MVERALPNDTSTEQAILAAIILNREAWHEAQAKLEANDFFSESHQLVFKAMQEIGGVRREAIDTVSILAELKRVDSLERAGGPAYISNLIEGFPMRANVPQLARVVREYSLRRRLIRVTNTAFHRAMDTRTDAEEAIEEAIEDLRLLLSRAAGAREPELRGSALLLASLERGDRVPLGWPKLDRRMRGGCPGAR